MLCRLRCRYATIIFCRLALLLHDAMLLQRCFDAGVNTMRDTPRCRRFIRRHAGCQRRHAATPLMPLRAPYATATLRAIQDMPYVVDATLLLAGDDDTLIRAAPPLMLPLRLPSFRQRHCYAAAILSAATAADYVFAMLLLTLFTRRC